MGARQILAVIDRLSVIGPRARLGTHRSPGLHAREKLPPVVTQTRLDAKPGHGRHCVRRAAASQTIRLLHLQLHGIAILRELLASSINMIPWTSMSMANTSPSNLRAGSGQSFASVAAKAKLASPDMSGQPKP